MAESKPKATVTRKPKAQEPIQKRVFRGDEQIPSDTYKLLVADMIINVGYKKDYPDHNDLLPAEHCHIYHTFNSDGKQQFYSAPIGNHFHKMELVPNDDPDLPPTVKCVSGPLKWGKKKIHGRTQKVTVPVNDYDDHQHETVYVKSEKVSRRQANVEAIAVQTAIAQKSAPMPGVMG